MTDRSSSSIVRASGHFETRRKIVKCLDSQDEKKMFYLMFRKKRIRFENQRFIRKKMNFFSSINVVTVVFVLLIE